MTKHHLEIVLGLVRKANLAGRLYPVPGPGQERRALGQRLAPYGTLYRCYIQVQRGEAELAKCPT